MTDELKPHTPEYLSFVQFPVKYDANVRLPEDNKIPYSGPIKRRHLNNCKGFWILSV